MHALIFLWQPEGALVHGLPHHDLAIAADSGLETASRWGVHVDVAVGDFDSTQLLSQAELEGVELHASPMQKDETDFELALTVALERGATSITVVGSSQGRADHALALLLGLGVSRLAGCDVRGLFDSSYVYVVRSGGSIALDAHHGRRVSLVPLHGDVSGVSTFGLQYALSNATLQVGSAFSVSNEFLPEESRASVDVGSGTLLVMQSPLFR